MTSLIEATKTETTDWIAAGERDYVITPWSRQDAMADPLVVTHAEGCHFVDVNGKRYLDFESQLVNVNLGYQHPKVVQAIKDQADRLCYIGPPIANAARSELAKLLAEVTPGDLSGAFFTTGGAITNENAIRLARHYTGRPKVIARYRSYHGATFAALTVSGEPRRWLSEPGIPGVVRMFDPYSYRCPAGHPDPCPVCTGGPHLEEILQYENPETIAAVLLETVTGTNGIIVPPDGYLQSIREVCDRYGILLILDEIMVGFGRTGRWFACENWDVKPDILCVAKGINSGYLPLGAVVVSPQIWEWLQTHQFPGGLTDSGHPLACASGVATIKAMREERTVEHVARLGELVRKRLEGIADRHPSVGEVRGLGLFWGLELVRDRDTRSPLVGFNAKGTDAAPMREITRAGMERGVYLSSHFNVLRVAPPLVIREEELEFGLGVVDEVLALADAHYGQ
jgi:taurine---2-oxoglutarate transaminase